MPSMRPQFDDVLAIRADGGVDALGPLGRTKQGDKTIDFKVEIRQPHQDGPNTGRGEKETQIQPPYGTSWQIAVPPASGMPFAPGVAWAQATVKYHGNGDTSKDFTWSEQVTLEG